MTQDDFSEFLTIDKAAKAVGCTRRTLYRLIERAGGESIVTHAFGRQIIHKSKLPLLKQAYLPLGSKKRAVACRAWGSTGGTQKRINREKAAKKA